jgi:hypothetical protein
VLAAGDGHRDAGAGTRRPPVATAEVIMPNERHRVSDPRAPVRTIPTDGANDVRPGLGLCLSGGGDPGRGV